MKLAFCIFNSLVGSACCFYLGVFVESDENWNRPAEACGVVFVISIAAVGFFVEASCPRK